jgi:hypothetical protein
MTASTTHNFLLTPTKTGKFAIEPSTLEYKGKIYSSNAIQVEVSNAPQRSTQNEAPVFSETFVSNENPFVNEQITLTFKLHRKVEIKNIQLDLSYDNFRKESLGKSKEYARTLNGVRYITSELVTALFPTRPGPAEIPGAAVNLDLVLRDRRRQTRDPFNRFFNDPFFGNAGRLQHKVIRTQPISLNIRPLPKESKPSSFSNLVGKFNITATIGKQKIKVGDTSTLTVKIAGMGNIQDAIFSLPNLSEKFKTYPDEPQLEKAVKDQQFYGEKTFKFALVPLKKGDFQIPALTLSYFEPDVESYVSVQTNPISLEILDADNEEKMIMVESNNKTTNKIKILGTDIFPNHNLLEDFSNQKPNSQTVSFYYASGFAPILIYLVLIAFTRQKMRLKNDLAFARSKKAYKLASKKLESLSPINGNLKTFVQELSQVVREYIGDKFNLNGAAFTSNEVIEKLKDRSFPEDQIIPIKNLLEEFENIQYGGTGNAAISPESLLNKSIETMKRLEKTP